MDSASMAVVAIMIATMISSLLVRRNSYIIIIAGFVIAFVTCMIMTGGNENNVIYDLGAISGKIRNGNELWRLLTAEFVHIDVKHLIFNMVFLFLIGRSLIACIGSREFALLFFFGGMLPSFFTSLIYSGVVMVGSSSSIAVVAGMTFVLPYMRTFIFDNTFNPRSFMRILILIWVFGDCLAILIGDFNTAAITYVDHMIGISIGLIGGLALSKTYPENEGSNCEKAIIDVDRIDAANRLPWIIKDPKCPVCDNPVVVKDRSMICRNGHCLSYNIFKRKYTPKNR